MFVPCQEKNKVFAHVFCMIFHVLLRKPGVCLGWTPKGSDVLVTLAAARLWKPTYLDIQWLTYQKPPKNHLDIQWLLKIDKENEEFQLALLKLIPTRALILPFSLLTSKAKPGRKLSSPCNHQQLQTLSGVCANVDTSFFWVQSSQGDLGTLKEVTQNHQQLSAVCRAESGV